MVRVIRGNKEKEEERPAEGLFSTRLIDFNMIWLPINENNESGKE
jgi:hypothetical protein